MLYVEIKGISKTKYLRFLTCSSVTFVVDFVCLLFNCFVGLKLVRLSSVWNEYIVTLFPPIENTNILFRSLI